MPKPKCHGSLRSAFFDSCCLKLKTWIYDLPPELRLDRLGPTSPLQAFTLHMVYSTACILLAHPYLSPATATTDSVMELTNIIDPKLRDEFQKADVLLQASAKQICSTARKYRRVFGSFRRSPITATHCTLSAALVFLRNARSRPVTDETGMPPSSSSTDDIKLCLAVLDELSTSWDTARRIRLNLLKLVMKSQVAGIDVSNYSPRLSKDQIRNGTGDLGNDPESLQPSGSSLDDPSSGNQHAFQYRPLEDHLQGSEAHQSKSPMDAMSASLGFGLEHTLETMIGDQFAFDTEFTGDDFEWDTFFQL